MKRVTLCLIIVSLVLVAVWFTHTPAQQEIAPLVSIADLQRQPMRYRGKLISVRGVLTNEQFGEAVLIDAFSAQRIPIYVEEHTAVSPLPSWVGYWSFCANDTQVSMAIGLSADALITGTFDGTVLIPTSALVLSPPSR